MNDRDFNLPLLIPNLAVLAFAAVGLLNEQAPLVSLRPGTVSAVPLRTSETNARLWQDPLAIKPPPAAASSECDPPAEPPLAKIFADAAREKSASRAARFPTEEKAAPFRGLILPVLLSCQNYPETVETRLRTRYAVLAALGRAQYVPVKPDRMQFALIAGRQFMVRYEEFEVRYLVSDQIDMPDHENFWSTETTGVDRDHLVIPHAYDRVVVLWLEEEKLLAPDAGEALRSPAIKLAKNLSTILSALFGSTARLAATNRSVVDVKIIGPTSSDTLLGLVDPTQSGAFSPGFPATLLSPRATAAPAVLQISATRRNVFSNLHLDSLPGISPAWTVERTIATDDQLVASVLGELQQRDAMPNALHHLVLVGEWDTLYSRGVARCFAAQLNLDRGAVPSLARRAAWATNPPFLHEFSYLRGLDGFIAKSDEGEEKAESKNDEENADSKSHDEKAASSPPKPEHANGTSQFDYLRRLEHSMAELEKDIVRRDGRKAEIRAVGVIGSDTYDKLLVLRALRTSFPRAIFFTTDFDASYCDTGEGKWTNNLLVVAPFGLSTRASLQSRIPPFRDSYQSALFLTVLQAIGVERVGGRPFNLRPAGLQPRIFELGRTGYVDLSPRSRQDGTAQLHPPTRRGLIPGWIKPSLILVLTLLMAALVWCWCARPLSLWDFFHITFGLLWTVGAIGLTAGICWLASTESLDAVWWVKLGLVLAAGLLVWSLCRTHYVLRQLEHRCLLKGARWEKVAGAIITLGSFSSLLIGGWFILLRALAVIATDRGEEPFAWFEGISVWPTEIVRNVALLVSVLGIVFAQRRLDDFKQEVTKQFRLIAPRKAIRWFDYDRKLWLRAEPGQDEHALWRHYCRVTRFGTRLVRIVTAATLYIVMSACVGQLLGNPVVPARGAWSRALDQGVLGTSVIAYTFLLFFVLDAIVLGAAFIKLLTPFIGYETKLPDLCAIRLVNDLTDEIASLIYFPFSVLFMFIVSRNALFDAWDWPPVLLIVFGTGLLLIVLVSLLLQSRARRAKAAALAALDRKIAEGLELAQRQDAPGANASARQPYLEEMRTQIGAFDGVVFKSWHQNPIFRAILIPLGGVGSLQLLDRFSNF